MRSALLLLTLCLSVSAKDTVILKNGDSFYGKVAGLSDGFVHFNSPHSEAPLDIVSDQLRSLSFEEVESTELPTHSHQVNLRNGDVIPGEVTALDEKQLTFQTWFAGSLTIPRNQIESVFYGVKPQPLIYQGPKGLDGWEHSNDWNFNDSGFDSNDRGNIARKMDLPNQFIFKFNLTWRNSPNLRIHFCTEATQGNENKDGYYLAVTNQGMHVYRLLRKEGENQNLHHLLLGSSNKRINEISNRQAQVELRVDRANQRIILYINDEKQPEITDVHSSPTGQNIIFESQSSGRRQVSIRSIKIHEWDAVTENLRREPRSDQKSDTLATDEGDRYSGNILNRAEANGKPTFHVKIPLAEQPIPIPETNCAVLYFAEGTLPEKQKGLYNLALASGGTLNLSNIRLEETTLTATHPWLGQMTLDRKILREITRNKVKKPSKKEEKSSQSD